MQSQEGALSEQTSNFQVERRAMVSIDGRKVPNFLAANLEGMEALLAHAMPAMPSPPGCSFLLCGALTAINFSRSLPLSPRHR
jgi:hypothetical protein